MKNGIELIAEERQRQIEKLGFSLKSDERYKNGDLALAGAAYAVVGDARECYGDDTYPSFWPWDDKWWKPSPENRIKELQKAGALIAAEIDRIINTQTEK